MSLLPISRLFTVFITGGFFLAALIFSLPENKDGAALNGQTRSANADTVRLSGQARIVDGDTIRLNGKRIRILGMDAPELKQTCTARDGTQWACGEMARKYLISLLANATLVCKSSKRDIYARLLARCTLDGVDIGATMVRQGLAVSYYDYQAEQSLAKSERIGVWQGEFVKPRTWRNARK